MKMATGEVIGAEELGGAKVHAMTTGLADQIASDEYGFWYASYDTTNSVTDSMRFIKHGIG